MLIAFFAQMATYAAIAITMAIIVYLFITGAVTLLGEIEMQIGVI